MAIRGTTTENEPSDKGFATGAFDSSETTLPDAGEPLEEAPLEASVPSYSSRPPHATGDRSSKSRLG